MFNAHITICLPIAQALIRYVKMGPNKVILWCQKHITLYKCINIQDTWVLWEKNIYLKLPIRDTILPRESKGAYQRTVWLL